MELLYTHFRLILGPIRMVLKIFPNIKFGVRWTSKKKVLVCRIETKEGIGPYRTETPLAQQIHDDHCDKSHPNVYLDVLGFEKTQVCGFLNLEDCRKWFGKFLEALSQDGLQLSVYEAPDSAVFYGERQITFQKEKANLVGVFSPLVPETINSLYDLLRTKDENLAN